MTQHSGSKYLRKVRDITGAGTTAEIDVYEVLRAFGVTSQPLGHAIKKLLCAGIRGKGNLRQDLSESIDAIQRAIDEYDAELEAKKKESANT